jgi:hypothetical protein
MIGKRLVCERGVFDGGVDDPRTRIYLYQQRLRADLLGRLDAMENRPWWASAPVVVGGPLRSIMGIGRARHAARGDADGHERRFVWADYRSRRRLGLVTLQGRLLGAVAAGLVSRGTLLDVAAGLSTSADVLSDALRALRDGGWVAVHTLPEEQLVVRLERRHAEATAALMPNRRVHADAWAL